MIRLVDVNKYFGDLHVLKNINLEVKEGEKLVVIGPSGSGKSTMIRCMNFLEEPTSGHVYIDGVELTHKNKTEMNRKNIAMVFQQFNLYPHMTVLENVTLAPIRLQGLKKEEAQQQAFRYLDIVGLREKAHVYPATLSGSQQQRVAIARALATHQKIILFDESTSALDPDPPVPGEYHHGGGHSRNGVCPTGGRPGHFYGPGHHPGGGCSGTFL